MRHLLPEPRERRAAAAAFITLACVMAGHAILETARDALFLRSLPATQLPWVYLIIALSTLVVAGFESRLARGARRRDLLGAFLFGAALATACLWAVADFASRGSLWLLYVWTGVFGTLATIHFWLSISSALTVTQAKRLFGPVGAGALAGAICGSASARVFVSLTETRNLVVIAAGCMAAGALAAHLGLRRALRHAGESEDESALAAPVGLRDAILGVRDEPYVRRVVALVLLSTIAITLADYLFKREVAEAIPPGELGSFFATFYASLNVLALVVQVGVTGWLLDRAGVPRTLAVLPALLAVGGLWAALAGGLPAVLLLKGTHGSLRHSLHRTATEVLYVPLPGRERDRAKTVSDVVGHRIGQAAGSLAILAGTWMWGGGSWVAWGVTLASGLAVALALGLRRPYLDVFRRQLTDERGARPPPPRFDRHALELGPRVSAGLARCGRLVTWHAALVRGLLEDRRRDTPEGAALRGLLEEELARELEQVVRMLSLRHPGADLRAIHRGLRSPDPVVRASCEELLSEVLPREDRRALLRLARADALDEQLEAPPFEEALGAMIDARVEAVSAIAASYAARLGERARRRGPLRIPD